MVSTVVTRAMAVEAGGTTPDEEDVDGRTQASRITSRLCLPRATQDILRTLRPEVARLMQSRRGASSLPWPRARATRPWCMAVRPTWRTALWPIRQQPWRRRRWDHWSTLGRQLQLRRRQPQQRQLLLMLKKRQLPHQVTILLCQVMCQSRRCRELKKVRVNHIAIVATLKVTQFLFVPQC